MIRILVLLCALLLCLPQVEAQQPEWMMRIPQYYRLKGGASTFALDSYRGAMLFDGGPYDTYVTYDAGETWETIFDIKMFFIDVSTTWRVDGVGNWYYQGNVYGKLTLNLVTEDAGKTIRFLIADTNAVPGAHEIEPHLKIALSKGVCLDYSGRGDDPQSGIYTSCDVGKSWAFHPLSSHGNPFAVGDNRIALGLSNKTWIEYDVCAQTWDSTGLDNAYQYVRLGDGTVIQFQAGYNPSAVIVRRPGVSTPDTLATYKDVERDTARKLLPVAVSLMNDTMALIVAKDGVVATYSVNAGLQYIDIPPYRDKYQWVADIGVFGDRMLSRSITLTASMDSVTRYVLLNLRTGARKLHIRPGTVTAAPLFVWTNELETNQRVVPFSDSVWLASLWSGELLKTTDAGYTWRMVDNINRDERWGLTYVAVNRLFPRGDGRMAALTEHDRLMVSNTQGEDWRVTHLGPFRHKMQLANGLYSSITNSPLSYGEDSDGMFRVRYGPSTAFFHSADTVWTSGDVVSSWTTDGEFIKTILPRKARFIKRVTPEIIVASMDSVWISFDNGREWVYANGMMPIKVHGNDTILPTLGDIAIAANGDIIAGIRGVRLFDTLGVVVDSIPGGIMRSTTNGQTWSPGSTGVPDNLYVTSVLKMPSGVLLCIASEVTLDPTYFDRRNYVMKRLPLSQCGLKNYKFGSAYIYRSLDNGHNWDRVHIFQSREHLANTDPRLVLMPDGRPMAINPDAGIAISDDDGAHFGVGDPPTLGNLVINDVVFTDDGWVHFATNEGYVRVGMETILDVHEERVISGSLSAHVSNEGVLRITASEFSPTSVRLLSLDGRTVREVSGSMTNGASTDGATVTELNVASLASGTYIVVATTVDGVRTALIQL